VATVMKAQYAKLGVRVTVEALDRPIFLRRVTRDCDWGQLLQASGGLRSGGGRLVDRHPCGAQHA
jgi:hypothetical protein